MTGRALVLTLAFALFLLAGAPAFADGPHTSTLDLLITEIGERDDALTGELTKAERKEKKALAKAAKILAKEAESVLDDLKMYGKLAKLLPKTYPGDPEMEYLLADALSVFTAGIIQDLAASQIAIAKLDESKEKEKALKYLGKAQLALIAAQAEAKRAKSAKLLAKTEKFRLKAEAAVAGLLA